MSRLGASVICACVAFALPAVADGASHSVSQNDVTGAIGNDTQNLNGVPSNELNRPSDNFSYPKPVVSYEQAYRNWRTCAAEHQGVGNPPPQCEELRAALRDAIGARPRSEAKR